MKINELQQKTKEELKKILSEQRDKLRSLRFDVVLKKIKNVREIRKIKKNIARILTILNKK
ncbi:MAG: 50S ribosomal protein L29 [Patescibacteria group bacterium]|nr:50S ribosomal protein L29 [Patescibacteria group bacterium]